MTSAGVIESSRARLDSWLDAPGSERRARTTMSLFAALIVARLAFTRFAPMSRIPAVLFDPPWYLAWLSGPPSVGVIVALQVLGVVAAIASVVVPRRRVAFAVAWVVYLVLAGIRASRGKIIHPDVLPLLAMIPVLFTPDDASRRGDRVDARFGIPVNAAVAVVGVTYFFTGYQKVVTSGLDWVTSDNLRWVLVDGIRASGVHARGAARWVIDHPFIAHVVAVATLIVECGAPAIIPVRKLRVPFAIAATGMHLGIYLMLNLDYSLWVATVWIVMAGELISRPRTRAGSTGS